MSLNDFTVTFDVLCDTELKVFLSMDEKVLFEMNRRLFNNETDTVDEEAVSALCEMGNLMLGHVSKFFSGAEILFQYSPPLMFMGFDMFFRAGTKRISAKSFDCDFGRMSLALCERM